MAYLPDPADATQPTGDVKASTAAAEFRALKGRVNTITLGNTAVAAAAALSASAAAASAVTAQQLVSSVAATYGGAGYFPPVAYGTGIDMSLAAQTVSYLGQTYAPILSALPFTTSGTFETAKFRLIQGVVASDLSSASGSNTIGFQAAGTGATTGTVQTKLRDLVTVRDFGALGAGADETAAAVAMITAYNRLVIPKNFTLVAKNINLANSTEVICEGTLKLPNACVDFDRLLIGTSRTGLSITIKELDGNYAGQSGTIGTHLIYLTNCPDAKVAVQLLHDHYVSSGAPMPSVDGIRNVSCGPVVLWQCARAIVDIGLISGWGREAIYVLNCTKAEVTLGHAQGKYLTEYSGVQVSGVGNSLNRASVDFAGASAVGFDTAYGFISNILATNTRENHGVNFGHTGYPATGSVANNIVVDGAFGNGIQVGASSQGVSINNFSVQNTGDAGIQFSDGVTDGKLSNGTVSYPSQWNLVTGAVATIEAVAVKSEVRDAMTLLLDVSSGIFVAGEAVSTATGSATVRKALRNLTAAKQRLFFTAVTGTFTSSQAITGATSTAVGTINTAFVPVEYYENAPGQVVRNPRNFPGTGNQIRFADGTAFFAGSASCAYTSAGSSQDFSQPFFSNALWIAAPQVVVSLSSFSVTSNFVMSYLTGTATTGATAIKINASVNQTYGVSIQAIGRWK